MSKLQEYLDKVYTEAETNPYKDYDKQEGNAYWKGKEDHDRWEATHRQPVQPSDADIQFKQEISKVEQAFESSMDVLKQNPLEEAKNLVQMLIGKFDEDAIEYVLRRGKKYGLNNIQVRQLLEYLYNYGD
jgi:hypothetical protein